MNRLNSRQVSWIALLFACALSAAWVRSLSTTDMVEFVKDEATTDVVYSFDGSLVWMQCYQRFADVDTAFQGWSTLPKTDYDFFKDADITWLWRWGSNGIGYRKYADGFWSLYFAMHYSTFIIPLAVLAKHLLRWKRREPESSLVLLEE